MKVLIIPDVHGRKFWKERLDEPHDLVIFLGDYVDPYSSEGISKEDALKNFIEIIEYKKSHDNVILLLGNHDLHYLDNLVYGGRRDEFNRYAISNLFANNYELFQIGYYIDKITFTHAPIIKGWAEKIKQFINIKAVSPTECIDKLNSLWYEAIEKDNPQIYGVLSYCSIYRGGMDAYGSPVWADVREVINKNPWDDWFEIFGHTQLKEIIKQEHFACIDCHKSFMLDELI